MILTCPSCGTQYVVKDGAIPPEGRQVRCASCKHSWHQDPEQQTAAASESEDSAENESIAEATLIDPRSGPEAEERAYEEAMVEDTNAQAEAEPSELHPEAEPDAGGAPSAAPAEADWGAPPQAEAADDEFSPFASPGELESKARSPIVKLMVVALVVAALAAAFWFFAPPEWKARVGLADSGMSPLALVTTHMDRQRLESGNELLTVTGRVINPTSREQDVPPLQAQLRTRTGQVVYSWTIAPPARTLAAGASASFNSAEVNVPPGGDELTITLGPAKA